MLPLALILVAIQGLPLNHAHAHNDYAQKRPLVGAMERQFGSIEADVYPIDGELFVAHDRNKVSPDKTLLTMYLKPLFEAARNNKGHVYPSPSEVILLVDIKEKGAETYEILKKELEPYRKYLSHFRNSRVTKSAITVILSGDRPINVLAAEHDRYAFIDGRPQDPQDKPYSPNLVPLISASWSDFFKYRGTGKMDSKEQARLDEIVGLAHRNHQIVRFWATPENESMWTFLCDNGVDLIGSDLQEKLAEFFRSRP